MSSSDPQKILFFDGVCSLCNGFIDFLISRDPDGDLRFAPLQSDIAKQKVPDYTANLSTVVFYESGRVYTESSAALRAIATVGGVYVLAKGFLIFPAFLRNVVYRFVAKNRYQWFGKRETCRIPSPEEKQRFLG